MRTYGIILIGLIIASAASADLQNVEVGGEIHIRGIYLSGAPDSSFTIQRSRIHVKADFTDQVSAFLELDSFDTWGEDFRSANYILGTDTRANSADDVEFHQAYIDAQKLWGTPLGLRVGRQEIVLGSGWLIGNNDNKKIFSGLSFDAIHLTYATETFAAGVVSAKGADLAGLEKDGDVDLYAAYANYTGFEDTSLLAYWIFGRDARSLGPGYDPTQLHTLGLRGNGKIGAFDYDAELAYQFGNADQVGFLFKDSGAEWNAWAANAEIGYTFESAWTPRVFLGGAYFGGEDNRDKKNEASVSFNRLFSNTEYGILDYSDLSNAWIARGGIQVSPLAKVNVSAALSYLQTVDPFQKWWKENDSDLGWETALLATYHYSDDLVFRLGWNHLFSGDGLQQGNYVQGNGLVSTAGKFEDDVDLVFADAQLTF